MCDVINFTPHTKQMEVLNAFAEGSKYLVVVAGRRWGKSDIASKLALYALLEKDCHIWIVSKTYDLANKVWEYLEKDIKRFFPAHTYEIRGSNGKFTIKMNWGAFLELKSADHEQSLVGSGIDLLIVDEAAFINKHIWTQRLAPTLIDKKGTAVFISTPEGKNWLYDMYEKGQNEHNSKYWSLTSPSWDNPYLDEEELNTFKDLDSLSYKQQCGAEFIAFANMVYEDFDTNIHVINERNLEGWSVSLSIDPGYAGACAMLWIAHNKISNEDIVIKEVIESRLKNEDVLNLIIENEPEFGYEALICDVAGRAESQQTGESFISWMEDQEWMRKRRYWFRSSGQSIISGLSKVRSKLLSVSGISKLFIFSTCKKLIQAMENYSYPEDLTKNGSELPIKDGVYDHPVDALRYYITWRYEDQPTIRNIKARD